MRGGCMKTWLVNAMLVPLLISCAGQHQPVVTHKQMSRLVAMTISYEQARHSSTWKLCGDITYPCRAATQKTTASIDASVAIKAAALKLQSAKVAASSLADGVTVANDIGKIQAAAVIDKVIILFNTNSSFPARKYQSSLDKAITHFADDGPIKVSGYADSVGAAAYNDWLAERRAQHIKSYLISKGVSEERITAAAHGACCFVSDNGTSDGRAMNRRVEVIFDNHGRGATK